MKKMKFTAALIVALMVTSTIAPTVFAYEQTDSEIGGGISEGNIAEDIFRVVLPTTNDATFDFVMDPNNLLFNSSLGGDRDTYDESSVYFTKTAAATVAPASGSLYVPGKVATDLAAVNASVTVGTGDITAVDDNALYVWTPKAGSETTGLGEWIEIDLTNIKLYFNFTYNLAGDAVETYTYAQTLACDEVLYYVTGVEATPAEAYLQLSFTDGAISGVGTLCSDAALATAADPDDLTVTPAATTHTKSSATATAVNKSTFGVILNVQTDVANTETPVTFTETGSNNITVNDGTDLNFAVDILGDDGTAVANVEGNENDDSGTTNVDFFLDGDNSTYTQYQGEDNLLTGGHTYNYLEKTNATWEEVDFGIQAACNTNADWSTYNSDLTADNRLEITVIFTMTSTDVDPTGIYNATTGVIVLPIPVTPVAPSITGTSFELAEGVAEEVTVDLGAGTSAATDLTVSDGVDALVEDTDYTFDGTTLTFVIAYVDAVLATGTDKVLDVEFNDAGTDSDVTITLTIPEVAPSISTVTYAMSSDTAVVVDVSLGYGDLAATGITSISFTTTSGASATVTQGTQYTFENSQLTFTSAFVNTLIGAGVTNRNFVVHLNDTATTDITVTLTH